MSEKTLASDVQSNHEHTSRKLVAMLAMYKNQNLSEHIECTTADFSGFFVRGIVCNHFNLNPLEKAQTSNLFQSNGFNVNLTEKQIIATKK